MVIAPWLTRRTPDMMKLWPNTEVEPAAKVTVPGPARVPARVNEPVPKLTAPAAVNVPEMVMSAAPTLTVDEGVLNPPAIISCGLPEAAMAPLSDPVPVMSMVPGPARADPPLRVVVPVRARVALVTVMVPLLVRFTSMVALSPLVPL